MADIDWAMSARLDNVTRGGSELPEVTSLERAICAWVALDDRLQNDAVLTPELPVTIDGEVMSRLEGPSIRTLAERLPR